MFTNKKNNFFIRHCYIVRLSVNDSVKGIYSVNALSDICEIGRDINRMNILYKYIIAKRLLYFQNVV